VKKYVDNNYHLTRSVVFGVNHFLYPRWSASYPPCCCYHFDSHKSPPGEKRNLSSLFYFMTLKY